MAKIKVRDNRGQAKKKAKLAKYGKMRKVQKVGANKLVPVAQPAGPAGSKPRVGPSQQAHGQQSGQTPVRQKTNHNLYACDSDRQMLLLGEGDLGFAAALATLWGECPKMVATTLQRESEIVSVGEAEDNIELIRACGGKVLFGVDATKLRSGEAVGRKKGFERIIFNFPLAGGGSPKDTPVLIAANQALMRDIFVNVASGSLLSESGELHVTIPRGMPYEQWSLPTLAKIAGLRVRCATPFEPSVFPGYNCDAPHTGGGALTYSFIRAPRAQEAEEPIKKKFDGSVKDMVRQRRKKARRP